MRSLTLINALDVSPSRLERVLPPVVLVLQHVPCEPPGLIADVLTRHGVALEYVRPFEGEPIPRRLGRRAGLVVMGGPMSVYEQAHYPFLRPEIALLEDAVIRQRPILGICLGSQLLATALGAPVFRARQKELGWHPVTLAPPAAADPLWRGAPESFYAFHWHGDVFSLPRGAVRLAWSVRTECQAFRYGPSAYGLLFHLETTEGLVRGMTRAFPQELLEAGVTERQILTGAADHLPTQTAIGHEVFEQWTHLVRGGAAAEVEVDAAWEGFNLRRPWLPSKRSGVSRDASSSLLARSELLR